MFTSGEIHGSASSYRKGCRCQECKASYRETKREQAQRRHAWARENPDEVPHGTSRGYKTYGCRCQSCDDAEIKRRRDEKKRRLAWAKKNPDKVRHGTNGTYQKYDCRCQRCRAAHAELMKVQAQKRKAASAEEIPHGTPTGQKHWGCQCEPCAKAATSYDSKKWSGRLSRTLENAKNHGKEWTGPELEIAAREDLSIDEIAAMLGRTYQAVRHARRKMQEDPRFVFLAGLATGGPTPSPSA